MKSWFYLILAYMFLIAAFIVAVIYENFGLMLACIAMGWCSKLESEK